MCQCKGGCNCNDSDINKFHKAFSPVFEKHKAEIARVYQKHGFGSFVVNPLTAGVAYAHKPAIAGDLADIIFTEYNGTNGDDKTRRQQITSTALGLFGDAMGMVSSIFGARAAANAASSNTLPGNTGVVGPNIPGYSPPPPPPTPPPAQKKIFGMSYTQAAIAAGVVALILVLLFLQRKPAKA